MKKILLTLWLAAVISSPVFAADPLLKISWAGSQKLFKEVTKIADVLDPQWGALFEQGLKEQLGSPELAGVDGTRPWQAFLWFQGLGQRPLIALFVPVSDFDAFKRGLTDGKFLAGENHSNLILNRNKSAAIILTFGQADQISDQDRATVESLKLDLGGKQPGLLEIQVKPDEVVRGQALASFALARFALAQAIGGQNTAVVPGFDPEALKELMSFYLDNIETFVKGFTEFKFTLGLKGDQIRIRETVSAKPGSELSRWMVNPTQKMGDLTSFLDPDAPMTFVANIGERPGLMPIMKKLNRLGLKLQYQDTDQLGDELDRLLDKMTPVQAAGSVNVKDGIAWEGIYRFPNRSPNEVYTELKNYMTKALQSQVGPDKIYSEARFLEAHGKIDRLTVDRLSLKFNLDNPAFGQATAQQEVFQQLFNDGTFAIDYVVKNDFLLMASSGHMENLVRRTPGATPSSLPAIDPNTAFAGTLNLIQIIQWAVSANASVLPQEIAESLQGLDPADASATFKINIGPDLDAQFSLPLAILSKFGRLKNAF